MEHVLSQAEQAFAAFGKGTLHTCCRYGNGHINETYLCQGESGAYILQKLNQTVFPHPERVIHNIRLVTEYLRALAVKNGEDASRTVLTLHPTTKGDWMYRDEAGDVWRLYDFIQNNVTLEFAQSEEEFAQAGEAFGKFAASLAEFPADQLEEVIPRFHDTPKRFADFLRAKEEDALGRAASVAKEIAFFEAHADFYPTLLQANANGTLPLRVTHNDTKLNNILFDAETRTPLCVIDLDTVMPGFTVTDFGDAIRFGASTAAEDEKDLSLVHFSMEKYRAYVKGYLRGAGEGLLPAERELLPEGAIMMTLECGMRFLADYLAGDVYFRIHRPEHNLDRCRTQIRLAEEMLANIKEMKAAALA